MTADISKGGERSGAIRSSHTSPRLSVLVMSGDPERRGAWAKFFEDQGMNTIRCAGPVVTTCALELSDHCPLHDAADLIFYDAESVTPALEEQLDNIMLPSPIAYAGSMRSRGGRQYPVTQRVRSSTPRSHRSR